MVVVTFKLLGKPEKLTEIRQSLNEIAVKVKKLDGCRDTKVYLDMNDENLFFMVEEWQNQRHETSDCVQLVSIQCPKDFSL